MATVLKPIECSAQPLSISFHPSKELVAAGLVDGTLEVHDLIAKQGTKRQKADDDDVDDDGDDDDEADTILSSIFVAKKSASYSIPAVPVVVTGGDDDNHLPAIPSKARQNPSCRSVLFSRSPHDSRGDGDNVEVGGGEHLFSGCNGGSIRCLDSERACSISSFNDDDTASHPAVLWSIEDAHPVGLRELHQLPHCSPAGPLLCSGDDAGTVRLWDARMCGGGGGGSTAGVATARRQQNPFDDLMTTPPGCVAHWKVLADYVSGFASHNNDGELLLASSADGRLAAFDLRFLAEKRSRKGNRVCAVQVADDTNEDDENYDETVAEKKKKAWETRGYRRSDPQGDELLSVCIMKSRKKVMCGTQEGPLHIWSYGTWGDVSDRFPGHPSSIDALLKVDEDTVLTGSSDGLVRAVQIQPNKFLGVLGGHDGFPVEALAFSAGRKYVGSTSHDEYVRLWDASILNGDDEGEEDGMEEEDGVSAVVGMTAAAATTGLVAASAAANGSDDEWDDMDEEKDEEMEDSDDSDDSDEEDNDKNKRGQIFKTDNERFFEDL